MPPPEMPSSTSRSASKRQRRRDRAAATKISSSEHESDVSADPVDDRAARAFSPMKIEDDDDELTFISIFHGRIRCQQIAKVYPEVLFAGGRMNE